MTSLCRCYFTLLDPNLPLSWGELTLSLLPAFASLPLSRFNSHDPILISRRLYPLASLSLRALTPTPSSPSFTSTGNQIRAVIPYIKIDVPIVAIFRALGFVADRDILEHIAYDMTDRDLMERFRPSLEEAFVIQDQNVALDFIGRRGSQIYASKQDRVRYAYDILQKEMLPHVGVEEHCERKKAYFLGYVVHKLLMCSLGRLEEGETILFLSYRLARAHY